MNALKPLVFILVLAGIGYGVYSRLNNAPDSPPPEAAGDWEAGAQVRMPGEAEGGAPEWATTATPTSSGLTAALPGGVNDAAAATQPQRGGFNLPPNSADPTASTNTLGASSAAINDSAGVTGGAKNPFPTENQSWQQPSAAGASSVGGLGGAIELARRQLDDGHLVEGLEQLSLWHDDPRLSPLEQQELTHLLDQVAGTVIYSTKSLLEKPYDVQPGERLEDIAQRYNVPWQLLAKINGLENANDLQPGEQIKVLRGPFTAVINLETKQLTVKLNGAYAGTFSIGLGREYPASEGQFVVTDKLVNPTYHGLERAIDADDPSNPLGERWIGLGDKLSIHGTNNPSGVGRSDLPGCISLAPRDAEDVFDILSVGSKVVIRR